MIGLSDRTADTHYTTLTLACVRGTQFRRRRDGGLSIADGRQDRRGGTHLHSGHRPCCPGQTQLSGGGYGAGRVSARGRNAQRTGRVLQGEQTQAGGESPGRANHATTVDRCPIRPGGLPGAGLSPTWTNRWPGWESRGYLRRRLYTGGTRVCHAVDCSKA